MLPLINNGAHGVDLFVVVSGFCLALPLTAGHSLRIGNFFRRRAFRLLPAYYVALAVASALALMPVTAPLVVGRQASGEDVLLHALFLQTVVPGHIGTINGSLWSVALEVQLYLCFPLTLAAYRRFGGARTVLATGALAMVWISLAGLGLGTLGQESLLPGRLVQFVVGMWVAEQIGRERSFSPVATWTCLIAGGGAGLVVSPGHS